MGNSAAVGFFRHSQKVIIVDLHAIKGKQELKGELYALKVRLRPVDAAIGTVKT
ncbi:hypothetical protein C5S35_00995 [Candidatus Methanophagaceae archaeon]|nr:hypothetical protein C5S35_00995 [Methanophagales archaeon]